MSARSRVRRVREEVRDRLQDTAERHAVISCSDLVDGITEIEGPHSRALADMLGEISLECHRQGDPLLSALAVYWDSGEPGPGFFASAGHLGAHTGPARS